MSRPSRSRGVTTNSSPGPKNSIGRQFGATVIGDALIASFNVPLPVDGYPGRAVGAACALLSLVSEREFEGHRLRLRIGVATGPVAAGSATGPLRRGGDRLSAGAWTRGRH